MGNEGHQRRTQLAAVPEGGLLTAVQVAQLLCMSEAWVWKQVKLNAGFPFIRLGGRMVRFNRQKVLAWLAAREEGAGA